VLGAVPNTSKGGKAHLTISFGNITTPTTLDFWKKSDTATTTAFQRADERRDACTRRSKTSRRRAGTTTSSWVTGT
jgi:hypothetical protein